MRAGLKTRYQAFRIAAPGRGKASPSLRSTMLPHHNPFACLRGIVDEENHRDGFTELPFDGESAFHIRCLVKTNPPRRPWEERIVALARYGLYLMRDNVDMMIAKNIDIEDIDV